LKRLLIILVDKNNSNDKFVITFQELLILEKLHCNPNDYVIKDKPFYQSVGNEIDIFDMATKNGFSNFNKRPNRLWKNLIC